MRETFHGEGPGQGKIRVVEIIGPAGAGKSTLCRLLDQAGDQIQLQNFPDVRKIKDAPFFVSNGLQLMPSLLRSYRPGSRHLTRREFAWLAILRGWSSLFERKQSDDGRIIILDQGPVYLMAEMRLFGPEYLRQKDSERLWQDFYHRWRETLHMIISLDAADVILMDRIRNRQQEHVVKQQPEAVVYEFLQKYRTEYEFLLSIFTSHNNGFKVFQYDTGTQQPDGIAKQFLQEISCGE
jgi:adenylate kinase family enzyme